MTIYDSFLGLVKESRNYARINDMNKKTYSYPKSQLNENSHEINVELLFSSVEDESSS